MKKTINAYAKINLFLDIDSIRADGYHNIISYMQTVDLHDTITVDINPAVGNDEKNIEIKCDNPNIPCDKSNLVYRAADIFPNLKGNISIKIDKRIPMSAGLAGGSADAAATLLAINGLCDNPLSRDELKVLGNSLGADVPFCIEKGACIALGTGEILNETAPMPHHPIVIAKMGEGMSTPQAYHALDEKNNKFADYTPNTELLNILISKENTALDEYCRGLFNIFESVVEPIRPNVTLLKNVMNENGASGSMMSGSGTSVFGIFYNEEAAKNALNALKILGSDAHLCYPFLEK